MREVDVGCIQLDLVNLGWRQRLRILVVAMVALLSGRVQFSIERGSGRLTAHVATESDAASLH